MARAFPALALLCIEDTLSNRDLSRGPHSRVKLGGERVTP